MSLIDDVRRTVTDAANSALEKGQQAANTALEKGQQAAELMRLQAKLQQQTRERGRKLHELGARTLDWFHSGTMVVSGPVPPNVVNLCHQLETLNAQVDETQREFDEAKTRAISLPDASQTPDESLDSPATPQPSPPATGGIPLPPGDGSLPQVGPSDP